MGGDAAEARVMVALLGPVETGPAGGVLADVPQPRMRVLLGLLGLRSTTERFSGSTTLAGAELTVDFIPRGSQICSFKKSPSHTPVKLSTT